MHPIWRFTLTAVAAAAIALGILAIPVLFRGDDGGAAPRATPKPGLYAKVTDLRTMPDVGEPTRKAVAGEISAALVKLYDRAFAAPLATPGPGGTPVPGASTRARSSFTPIARAALAKHRKVFDEGSDLSVYSGTVTYSGVVTFDGKTPLEAFIEIDFSGEATPPSRSPVVKVRQRGSLVLKNTPGGWLIDGFDLRYATRPLVEPTPR